MYRNADKAESLGKTVQSVTRKLDTGFQVLENEIKKSERSLRAEVIRLAHQRPELRKHLLPLLRQASSDDEEVDLKGVVSEVVSFMKSQRQRPDWIVKNDYPQRIVLNFKILAGSGGSAWLSPKELRRYNTAWNKTRKSLAKYGLIPCCSTDTMFQTASGRYWEVMVGGLSSGPGAGEQIPIPG